MEISDKLLCLFSAEITEQGSSYYIEVPKRELTDGSAQIREGYRVALLAGRTDSRETISDQKGAHPEPSVEENDTPAPPVEEGEIRTVEIVDIGDRGDGIARVERGYVVIIPGTEKGERVTIEITDVRRNLAFANVEERIDYYE